MMDIREFLDPRFVGLLYRASFFCSIVLLALYLITKNGSTIIHNTFRKSVSLMWALLISAFAGWICGQLETYHVLIDMKGGGDLGIYYLAYLDMIPNNVEVDWHTEWGWDFIISVCRKVGLSAWDWLLVIRIIYIGGMLASCYILMRGREWVAIVFFVYAYSFLAYGANGLRNGTATSLILIGISLFQENRLLRVAAIFFFLSAFSIHRSSILPILAFLFSWLFNISTRNAIIFWFLSILISLIVGNSVANFFASLGFDDRMSRYIAGQENEELMSYFSHTGFRWDFLLYSSMPILLVWYLTVKRNFKDQMFDLIANTYILSNAFWVMVIRAAFSNRFAYLSWFLYPLVLAYPLMRFKIWEDQDRKIGLILLAYASFTFLMYLRG